MGFVSIYRNLATCSFLLAISLIFATVSASPSPRWSCKPAQFPATNFPVYRYAGRASLSQARQVCRRLTGTVPVVEDLPVECLQAYYEHINISQGYAVVKNGDLNCVRPCQSNWCSGNCQDDNSATIVCLTFIRQAREIDFPACTELPIPDFGAVDYPNGKRFWAFARFRCPLGSVLNNSQGVFCEHNGQWRSFVKEDLSTTNIERTCTQVCPNIQILLNGIIRKPLTPFTQPEVKCFDGWTLKGQPSVNCQSSVQMWEISGGSCLRTCPPTKYIVNGFLLTNDTSSGSMAMVACKDGFTFHGNSSVRCLGNGQWSPINGSCKDSVANCQWTKTISRGFLHITTNEIGSTAVAVCSDNYKFEGDPNVTCRRDGKWADVNGSCQAICQSVEHVNNGVVVVIDDAVNSTAEIRCFQDFILVGDPTVRCQENGTWSSFNGSCEAVCPSIIYINNGIVYLTDTTVNATAEIRCFQNFSFFGDPAVHCQADGTWSGLNGSCEAVCPFVEHVNNGVVFVTDNTVNSTAEIKCFQNFTLVGDPTVRCQANGAWSSFNGTCEVACPSAQFIRNGRLIIKERTVQAQAVATCFENFTIDGNETTVECQKDGTWSSPKVSCLANCPPEAAIQDGFLNITDNVKGATATVVCLDGFTYEGPEEVWCTEFGTWSEVNGSCQVDSVTGSGGDSTTVGDTTVTTSSWLGAIPSKVVIALAVFFLCLLLILPVVLVTCTRRTRHYGVTDRSSSDKSEAKASTAEKHRPLVSSTDCENDTYDVLGAPATATFDQPPNDDVYDHVDATSKLPGTTQSGQGEPANNQPKLCESETRISEYTSITLHDLETKSQDRQPPARAAIQDAYTMVDLKTKKPRSDQEQTMEELTDAMDEINDLMGDPILPPRLEASL